MIHSCSNTDSFILFGCTLSISSGHFDWISPIYKYEVALQYFVLLYLWLKLFYVPCTDKVVCGVEE